VVDFHDPVGPTAKIIQKESLRCFVIFTMLYGMIHKLFNSGGFSSFFNILTTHFSPYIVGITEILISTDFPQKSL